MKTAFFGLLAAMFLMSPIAHAGSIKSVPPVDFVTQIGAAVGAGGAATFSETKLDAWKSPGLDGNGTLQGRAAGLTVIEGSIDYRAGQGHDAIGTGQNTSLSAYTGSESFTGATITGPGSIDVKANNVTGGIGGVIGGSGQQTIRN